MLLSLVLPAFALTVPLRATFKESVNPGEEAMVSSTTTAIAAAYSTTNGTRFTVGNDELTANKREGSGSGGLSFVASPAGSIREWAIYYIDADGNVLGDPDIVTMSFDASGVGNVAAGGGSRLSTLGVSSKKDGGGGQLFASTGRVAVQDSGANAAYIGIAELSNDGSGNELVSDPDMDTMDATAFAAFQAEGLDAIVSLSSYAIQVDGTLTIDGLSISTDGVVEAGADIEWHVGFYTGEQTCQKGGVCTPVVSTTLDWFAPIGNVKKKSNAAPRVTLKAADVVFESFDAALELSIEGDVRNLEVSAAMELYDEDRLAAAGDVVTLDPTGVGVQAKSTDDGDTGIPIDIFVDGDTDVLDGLENQGPPPADTPIWAYFANDLYKVTLLDGEGRVLSEHDCTLDATPRTVAGTGKRDVLVGECTQDPSGTEVRRLQLSIGSKGHMNWKADLASPLFATTDSGPVCDKTGTVCTADNTSALDGTVEISRDGLPLFTRKLQVNETEFALPFTFTDVPNGVQGDVLVEVYAPGPVTWTVTDGVATATDETGTVASFVLEDVGLTQVGDIACKGWTPEGTVAPKAASTEPLVLSVQTGPGKFVCR